MREFVRVLPESSHILGCHVQHTHIGRQKLGLKIRDWGPSEIVQPAPDETQLYRWHAE